MLSESGFKPVPRYYDTIERFHPNRMFSEDARSNRDEKLIKARNHVLPPPDCAIGAGI